MDVFRPPKPKGEGRNKEKFGAILAAELYKVIVSFEAVLSFIYPGADSTATNTGIYNIKNKLPNYHARIEK